MYKAVGGERAWPTMDGALRIEVNDRKRAGCDGPGIAIIIAQSTERRTRDATSEVAGPGWAWEVRKLPQ